MHVTGPALLQDHPPEGEWARADINQRPLLAPDVNLPGHDGQLIPEGDPTLSGSQDGHWDAEDHSFAGYLEVDMSALMEDEGEPANQASNCHDDEANMTDNAKHTDAPGHTPAHTPA